MSRGRTRAWTPSRPAEELAAVTGASSAGDLGRAATIFEDATQPAFPVPAPGGAAPAPGFGAAAPSEAATVPPLHAPQPAPQPSPIPGALVPGMVVDGRYRVVQRIGTGGMGQVWEAVHVVIGKTVALKVLQVGPKVKASDAERLLREARATAQISHPNVIDITDFGHTPDGSPYFVMERLVGQTLKEVVTREGALPWQRSVPLLRQLAAALQAAHAKGVIHRDLKPDNIFLVHGQGSSSEGLEFCKVIDFGIAKISDLDADAQRFTKTGMVCGTPAFMSPEQARGDKIDLRADIYALGCVAYQILTASLPFTAETSTAVLYKQLFVEPSPMSVAAPHVQVPADVEAFVLRCLRKDPALRFQNAAEVIAALDLLGSGRAPVAVPAERIAPPPAAPPGVFRAVGAGARPETTLPDGVDETLPSVELPRAGPPPQPAARRKAGATIVLATLGVVVLGGATALAVAWGLTRETPQGAVVTEAAEPAEAIESTETVEPAKAEAPTGPAEPPEPAAEPPPGPPPEPPPEPTSAAKAEDAPRATSAGERTSKAPKKAEPAAELPPPPPEPAAPEPAAPPASESPATPSPATKEDRRHGPIELRDPWE